VSFYFSLVRISVTASWIASYIHIFQELFENKSFKHIVINDLILNCLLRTVISTNNSNYFEGVLQLPFGSINKNHFIIMPDTYSFGTDPITCHAWNKDRSRKFFGSTANIIASGYNNCCEIV